MNRKYKAVSLLLGVLLVSSIITIGLMVSNNSRQIEEEKIEDLRASFSLMVLMRSELQRFVDMNDRNELSNEFLEDHLEAVSNIGFVGNEIGVTLEFLNVSYLCKKDLNEVDEDLVNRYIELIDYFDSITYSKPSSKEVDGVIYSNEYEYLEGVYSGDEFREKIKSIISGES